MGIQMMSRKDVARFFDVTPLSVLRWVERGLLKPIPRHSPMCFDANDVERLRQQRVKDLREQVLKIEGTDMEAAS
jgi:hypothetical protein